jgi:hypothetical protein
MIYYIATRRNALTLGPLLLYYRRDLLQFVRLVPSDSVELLRPLETGAVVWTDFDRYSTDETEKAASVCRQLVETRPGVSH